MELIGTELSLLPKWALKSMALSLVHPHAGGFMDFEPEVEKLLSEVDSDVLKLCIDTGHCTYAGFDPVAFMKRHRDRITYVHFKSTDKEPKLARLPTAQA